MSVNIVQINDCAIIKRLTKPSDLSLGKVYQIVGYRGSSNKSWVGCLVMRTIQCTNYHLMAISGPQGSRIKHFGQIYNFDNFDFEPVEIDISITIKSRG